MTSKREDRETLITEAAEAILEAMGGIVPDELESMHADAAKAALAVFEQAHTPTDDEPVAYGIYGRVTGNLIYVQVMDEQEVAEQSEFYDVVPLFRRPVQGEPTDAIRVSDEVADAAQLAMHDFCFGGEEPIGRLSVARQGWKVAIAAAFAAHEGENRG